MNEKLAIGCVLFNNDLDEIERLCRSVAAATRAAESDVEMIFINNGREQVLPEDVEGVPIRMIPSQGNIGFGSAHNLLINDAQQSDVSWYIGVNPDGFFLPTSLMRSRRWFKQASHYAMLEFRQVPVEHPKSYDFRSGETGWCSGAAFCVRPSECLELGGFDENIFLYCEDVDLSWRYRLADGKCTLMYDAYFYHDITDNRERHAVRLEMLKAGRYLGWKYGAAHFQGIMENELVLAGVTDDPRLLPRLNGKRLTDDVESVAHVVEFRRLFTFSAARW